MTVPVSDVDAFLAYDAGETISPNVPIMGNQPGGAGATDAFTGSDQPALLVEWDCGQCVQPICWQVSAPGAGGGTNDRDYPIVPGQEPDRCVPLASDFARFAQPPAFP